MKTIDILVYSMFIVFLLSYLFPRIFFSLFSFSLEKALKEPWRWVTNAFLHAGPTHLLFNIIVIYSIGSFIEREIGSKNMAILFFSSVIISNLFFGIMHPNEFAIGSSGFAFAIEGIATVLNPNLPILVWGIPTTMGVAGITFFLLELLLAFLFPQSGIAHIAHVGGFIVGVLFGYYLKKRLYEKNYTIEYYF